MAGEGEPISIREESIREVREMDKSKIVRGAGGNPSLLMTWMQL